MKTSFATRRKARIIGQDDNEANNTSDGDSQKDTSNPTVKRPSKPKHRSSLRLSFGPGGTSMTEDPTPSSEVFTPKKSSLSRQAISQNALWKAVAASDHLPIRQPDDRPSYSPAHLNELKTSTPSTPKDLRSLSDTENPSQALDIASKFGTALPTHNPLILTDAEIQEKKLRRARLAKEQKYKTRHSSASSSASSDDDEREDSHDSDEDEFRQNHSSISLLPTSRSKPSTRLVRDDEDLMEDFEAFVEDGGITLGRKAERAQKARKKAEIADLIAEAEGSADSADSDDSEKERRAEYEAAQTRKGMDGMRLDNEPDWGGGGGWKVAKTPPRITPLPSLGGCLERLRGRLAEMERERARKVKELEECQRERREVEEREGEIQRLLKETGDRYERLRKEAGMGEDGNDSRVERGLENLGVGMAVEAGGE